MNEKEQDNPSLVIQKTLLTTHDPFHIHALLALVCVSHIVYRCVLFARGVHDMGFVAGQWSTLAAIVIHGTLSLSSFVFTLPAKRIKVFFPPLFFSIFFPFSFPSPGDSTPPQGWISYMARVSIAIHHLCLAFSFVNGTSLDSAFGPCRVSCDSYLSYFGICWCRIFLYVGFRQGERCVSRHAFQHDS